MLPVSFWLPLFLIAAEVQPTTPSLLRAPDHEEGPVSPGEIVIVKSMGAGPPVLLGAQLDSAGKVTTVLAETRVLFDGVAAPLAYTVAGEMMVCVPYEIAGRKTTQVVVEYAGKRSAPATVQVTEAAPALFTLDSTGRGQAAILNELGCCNSKRNPAPKGSIATLYATGEGQTVPPGITGSVPFFPNIAQYPAPARPVKIWVGEKSAEIVYAAAAPHAVAGLLQVNFRVPINAPVGDAIPVTLSIGASRSPDGVTMAVRSAVQRILVVDPDAAVREHLSAAFSGAHYYVSQASNAREAVAQVESNLYPLDLVLLSVALPGAEQAEALRAIERAWPKAKVIVTAAALTTANLRSADLLGAQAIVARPFQTSVLLKKAHDLLHRKPMPYVN
jgi:uncharacterized protein (TIGR03437 family)